MTADTVGKPPTERPPASERRRFRRLAVQCGCWLEQDDACIYGTTVDLGLGGLFLRTALPLEPGSVVDVHLRLDGVDAPVVARGRIVWAVPVSGGSRPGVGVQFDDIESGAEALREFLGARGE